MRILITGACGFIGSHTYRYFLEQGHQVVGWDVCGRAAEMTVYPVDMLDREAVYQRLCLDMPDIIIHCAGAADVGKSFENAHNDYQRNVTVTHNLMFAIRRQDRGHIRIIFLSSAAVYGNPVKLPVTENMPLKPLSPYALHKVMCEDIFQYFHNSYDIDTKIVRIFSAYGEGLEKQIFWDMHNKARKTGRLDLFGTGSESRDYIHIRDLVQAIYLIALKAPKEELIYNVANGEEITIQQAAESFACAIGMSKDRIVFSGEKMEGAPINWRADIKKLKLLGYRRTVSFEEGILRYVAWAGEKGCS